MVMSQSIIMAIGDTDRASLGATVVKQADEGSITLRTQQQQALADFILQAYTAKHLQEDTNIKRCISQMPVYKH